ncbi:glycosyltransferase [Hyphobacterium marinum]|uniref:Glycosyltransferase n=1 Tax=Hyphobacterium marinum TaxID=3116574 RepID=A0ABU7LWA0_9PROT|nr:glycosyltransferase [Hyphobacterium sp. Y6023]MEE2565260.1 glycosyltransferase [Hyphobacterium sp. Y6023]
MRILITNHGLAARAGTELYVRDLAFGLTARGHDVICFAPVLGEVAEEIRTAGIAVTDTLDGMTRPGVIHGQHHNAAVLAYLAFPDVPAVQVCHGVLPWQEAALARFPTIRTYTAVDEACRDALVTRDGIPADRIVRILNGVDFERFADRGVAHDDPSRQTRALLLSNVADRALVLPFEQACRQAGFTLDLAGAKLGRVLESPETEFARYGVVFAKGRAAIEALAMGCAVILADYGRTGGLVTSDRFDDLRAYNFGLNRITDEPRRDSIRSWLEAIDWNDAALVTARIRAEAGFDRVVEAWEEIYRRLPGLEPVHPVSPDKAMADYLAGILPQLSERDRLASELYATVSAGLARDRDLANDLLASDGADEARARLALRLDPGSEAARSILDRAKNR